MNAAERSQLHQTLLSRRDAIAGSWYQAIARTSFTSLVAAEVRQQLVLLTQQAITFLLAESCKHSRAQAIGASLASLHYTEPAVVGRTLKILAQQLLEGLPAGQVVALQPQLAALLGGVAEGFCQQARQTILTQQEAIRGALISDLQQARQALEEAYDEVEQQVQDRTAELRAANESLRREIVERKQAEEALRESEETARVLLNIPTAVAALLDPKGTILDANKTMAQRFGMSVNEFVGLHGWDLLSPDLAERRKPYFDQAIESGEPVRFEDEHRGTWFDNIFYPVLDTQGKTTKVVVLAHDITESKRAEEALRKAHEELEVRVQERTAELAQANEALQAEIIVRKRAEEAMRRERDLAEALAEAAAVVSSSLDPDQVLDRILEQVSRVVPNDATNIMLVEDNQARIVRWRGYERFGAEELAPQAVFRVPETHGFQKMIDSGEPMVVPDTVTYPDWVHIPGMEWLRSYAAAPIAVRGQVVGFLNVDSVTPGFFTQAHAETLSVFADHAAAAIENAQLYKNIQQELVERKRVEEALRQRNRELALINRASQAFTSTLDLHQVLDTTLEEVRSLLDVSAYSVWLIDPLTDELVCRQATGPKGEIVRGWRLALGEGIAGWVAQSGESLIVPDTRADEHHFKGVDQQTGLELRSILGVPLRVKQDVIGVLQMVDIEVDRFTPAALSLVEPLAASAAIAIENARLYEQAQQEITERKQAEEALRKSEERYRTLFDGVPVGLYRSTPEGQLLDVNLTLVEMGGAPDRQSALATNAADRYVDPEERRRLLAKIDQEGIVHDYEYQAQRRDGTIWWVKDTVRAVRDANGQVLYYEGAIEDITERKKAEEKLRDREATMRALLNAPIEMATLVDADGIIIDANEAMARSLGKSVDELVGLCIYDFFSPEVAKFRRAQADRVFRSGSPVRFEDEREGRFFDTNLYPIFDAEGNVTRIAGYTSDITLRKQADERIRSYQDQLRSLASELSLTEERERRDIATALHDRVGQTLAICKIKLGALRQSASSSELSEPLEEIHQYIDEVIQDTRSLTFEISSPILYQLGLEAALEWLTDQTRKRDGIPSQFSDDGQTKLLDEDVQVVLFQAVRELLINVVKHAQAQHVEVDIRRNDNCVKIIVEDDGVGFDASPIGSHWSKTTGFGLFNIRERLEHLGGQTHIESKPGLGTKITLLAPLKCDDTIEK